jgi:hypothetical protein
LNKELNYYNPGYNLLKSPFFYVPDVKVKISYQDRDFKVYSPIDNSCWAAPTPCTHNKTLKVKNWHGIKIIHRAQN